MGCGSIIRESAIKLSEVHMGSCSCMVHASLVHGEVEIGYNISGGNYRDIAWLQMKGNSMNHYYTYYVG